MRLSKFLLLLIVGTISLSLAKDSFDITRSGRKIQLDGFLMDWIEKNRQVWNGSAIWSWDAINTPEGVAGYFRANGAPACSLWIFDVSDYNGLHKMVASAAKDTETPFYCVNHQQGNPPSLTVEWVVPWDSVAIDGNGNYAIKIAGKSACTDSLEPILLTGKAPSAHNYLPKHFAVRLVFIIALLVVFAAIQIRIRKKIPRKESPRRSA